MRRIFSDKACNILLVSLIILFSFCFFYSSVIFVSGLENAQNLSSDEQKAILCLNESKQIMDNMINDNFSIIRINDSLRQLYSLYDAQYILKGKKDKYDFSIVLPYCNDIKNVSINAYDSRDLYQALKKFYAEYVTKDMNTSSIDKIMNDIESEIKNERYEKVKPLVDQGYQEIINVKTSTTTLNLFYKSTTRNIKDFFLENWLIIIIVLLILLILFFIYKKTISRWLIMRKISNFEIRKNTLKELIMKTQKDYFEKGNMSDSNYAIRTKKFAELIRDIDRQIPLLKEDLMRIGGKKLDKEDKSGNKSKKIEKYKKKKK